RRSTRAHPNRGGRRSRRAPPELFLQSRPHRRGLRRARPPVALERLSLVLAEMMTHYRISSTTMSLTLHFHPLSSLCQKVLVGLYELDIAFTKHLVDLGNEAQRAAFLRLWPMGRFPVLRDEARGVTVPESSVVLEYVDRHYARERRLVP